MNIQTVSRIHSFLSSLSSYGIEIEDVRLHEDHGVLEFFIGEEREEWYRDENDWTHFEDAVVLIRKDFGFFAGNPNSTIDIKPRYTAHIWEM